MSTTGPRTSRREIARRSRGGRAEIARRWLEDRGRDRGIIRTWQARTTSHVESRLFEKAQHAMAVVEAPEMYKSAHVDRLLRQVPEWGREAR